MTLAERYSEDEFLRIDTPENVAFGYPIAGIGSRFLAALVDTILILILIVLANVALLLLANLVDAAFLNDDSLIGWAVAVAGLISFCFMWGYYIFFEMLWNGQSPGKRWAKLRVIRTDGTPITLADSFIRNLIRLIDFLPAYYGLGVVTMFVQGQARRLGDLAAGTLVVIDQANVSLDSLLPPAPAATETDLPVERLSDTDLAMAEDYLRRIDQLHNFTPLGHRVLQTLLARMNLNPEEVGIDLTSRREVRQKVQEIVKAARSRPASDPSPPLI